MNEHELPDDIKNLDALYQSPEDRIIELENILMEKNQLIKDLQRQIMNRIDNSVPY